jgi:regulatory protein
MMKRVKTKSLDSIYKSLSPEERELARQIQVGRTAIISWMKLSRKTSGQMTGYLRGKGYPEDLIRSIIESLAEDGYINDVALARRLVGERTGRLAESRTALSERLSRRGISEEVIEQVLPEANLDLEKAIDLINNKYGGQLSEIKLHEAMNEAGENSQLILRLQRKIGQYLANRGFSTEVVTQALGNCFPDMVNTEI